MSEDVEFEDATFGAGCFWCVEAIFQNLKGVKNVKSGYSGGHVKNPAYREVCNGTTGHAEVIRLSFSPNEISYATLLEVFFQSHNPTTLNQQGADVGTQYRSVIYYHSDAQRDIALKAVEAANTSGIWDRPVVTVVAKLENYYEAEKYHQNYFASNGNAPYCAAVIRPKMEKFRAKFGYLMNEKVGT